MFRGNAALKLNDSSGLAPGSRTMSVTLVEDTPGLGKLGSVVKLAIMPSDVITVEELDNFMVGYKNGVFRADEACPIHLVGKDQGKYRIFGNNSAFKRVNVLSSIQADIPEVDANATFAEYTVQDRALGGFVPTITQNQADEEGTSFDPKLAILETVSWGLALDREIRVFGAGGLYRTSANWNAANIATIAPGAEWNDADNGDPMLDIMDRIEASAQPIDGIWINPLVAHAVLRSKSLKDYIRHLIGDQALASQLADAATGMGSADFTIVGLPPFHVVSGKVLNETSGLLEFILDDTVILTSNPAGVGSNRETICTARTFRRKGPSGNGYTTKEFQLERRGLHGGIFYASGHAESVKMVGPTVGGAIFDVLQP